MPEIREQSIRVLLQICQHQAVAGMLTSPQDKIAVGQIQAELAQALQGAAQPDGKPPVGQALEAGADGNRGERRKAEEAV